ncbi:MAG: hypothetical protein HGA72_09545 [Chlorobiaceae bacterium]|nr:hypothetical protein [Chlorobiaceae bacterium]NTW64533.1 hypothetical protein [Chlorobiaceae bacterium]
MDKSISGAVSQGRVRIPSDLLKKFQAEKAGLQHRIDISSGILVFPEEILATLGYGELTKAGFEVVIMPRVAQNAVKSA